MNETSSVRRKLLKGLGLLGGLFAISRVEASHTDTHWDDETAHNIVYQCNKADEEYLGAIMFSVGEMVRKYEDDIRVVVTAFGPGVNLLLKEPKRPIPELLQQRVTSLQQYGVEFHACGNTLEALKVTEENLIEGVIAVPVGVDDLMQLQEKGYSYVSW